MNFLLDTNVISALRVRGRNPAVEEWAASIPLNTQFISAPTVAEIERGVTARERTDPRQGKVLRAWLEGRLLPAFTDRVVPFDLSAARVLGKLRVPEHAPLDDALTAAIAIAGNLTVATRNIQHFAPLTGVQIVNPWDEP